MADLNSLMTQASNGMGMLSTTILYMTIAAVLGGILLLVLYFLSFKHKVIVHQETQSGTMVVFTKAREFKTKDKVLKWRFLKLNWIKDSYAAPSDKHLLIGEKGVLVVHAARTIHGSVSWIEKIDRPSMPETLTSEEKLMTANELRRAEDYKKKKLSEQLMMLAPSLVVLMILVCFMIFWGDVVKPTKDFADTLVGQQKQLEEGYDKLTAASLQLSIASERLAQAYSGLPLSTPPANYTLQNLPLKTGDKIPN